MVEQPKPSFPDRRADYQAMVDEKARVAAQEAAQQAEAARQAELASQSVQAVVVAPVQVTDPMLFIFMHESGNNPRAINPSSGACGLGQALPCSKMPCSLSDYNCQVSYFTQYANERYGGWQGAYSWWMSHSWW